MLEGKKELSVTENEMVKVDISYERLDEDFDKVAAIRRHTDVNAFLGQLFNAFEVGRDLKKIVNPSLDYAVKFTPELLKKMEEHDVRFLTDKLTGELLPDLYDYTDKVIGGKIRLEVKGKPTGHDITNLNNAVNNMIEQQRYDALVEEIHQLHKATKRIERGMDNDRFAKVNAGRKHLLDAFDYQGSEEDKRKMVFQAIAMLREGRELIERTLLDKMDELDEVPEGKIKRIWTCLHNPEYFNEHTKRYDEIQEYFQYYYMSIQPMAYAYTYLEQPKLIDNLLEDSRKIFEHSKLNCLSSVEYLLPNDNFDGVWYKTPKEQEQKLLASYKLRDKEEDLLITVKGSEILEVLDDEREK